MPKTKLRLSMDIAQGHACSYNNCKYGCSELFYSQSEVDELCRIHKDIIDKEIDLIKKKLKKELLINYDAFSDDVSTMYDENLKSVDSVFDEVTKK